MDPIDTTSTTSSDKVILPYLSGHDKFNHQLNHPSNFRPIHVLRW